MHCFISAKYIFKAPMNSIFGQGNNHFEVNVLFFSLQNSTHTYTKTKLLFKDMYSVPFFYDGFTSFKKRYTLLQYYVFLLLVRAKKMSSIYAGPGPHLHCIAVTSQNGIAGSNVPHHGHSDHHFSSHVFVLLVML